MVGEQIGGLPSGDAENIGLSGRHSKAQQDGHPMPVGVGSTSQSGLLMLGSVQSGGREVSSVGRKQVSMGHCSMTSEHSEGISLGGGLGSGESGVGIEVGEQIGGLPSGDAENIGLSGRHSKAQHDGHPMPVGVGSTSQSGLLTLGSVQSGGREASSVGRKQVSMGHCSMTSEHSEGISLGGGLGSGLWKLPILC
jgi:hypothetical protein